MEKPRHYPPDNGPTQKYRRTWAHRITTRAATTGPIPLYGSAEWARLPADDPRKAASAVRAAEAWARQGDDLKHTALQQAYNLRRADDEFWEHMFARRRDMVDDHLDRVRVNTQRRQQPAPTGYTGGPVPWDGTP